jgi:hypothetical protein
VTSVRIRTAWSKDHKELVETRQIETKQGQSGQLIIKRNLRDQEKSMVVAFSIKLGGEPNATSCRQVWHKQA